MIKGDWVDTITGNTMTISEESIEINYPFSHTGTLGYTSTTWNIDGDKLTLKGCEYTIVDDGKKIVADGFEYIPLEKYYESLKKYNLGEQAETDKAKIIVSNVSFKDTVSKNNLSPNGKGYSTGDNNVTFCCFEFELENDLNENLSFEEICDFTLIYKDEYKFIIGAYADATSSSGFYNRQDDNVYCGIALTFIPLTNKKCRGVIECPISVSEGQESLQIIVRLRNSSGKESFKYVVR